MIPGLVQEMNLNSLSNETKLNLLRVPELVVVDTEGTNTMLGFAVAFSGFEQGMYFAFNHAYDNLTVAEQVELFGILHSKKALIFHNAVYDLGVLARNGFNYRGKFYDTMLMSHWIDEEQFNYGLEEQSKIHGCGEPKKMPDLMKLIIESDGWDAVPLALMESYSGNDALITWKLFEKLYPKFVAQGFDGLLWEEEQDFIRDVMGPMMDLGILTDTDFIVRELIRGESIMRETKAELGFNPNSPIALKKFLIDELGLPVVKHTKACLKCKKGMAIVTHDAKPSFDKEAMEEYDFLLERTKDERAKAILCYRGWLKTTSSNYKPYLLLADQFHVLHPGYKLHGTKTGRLSCENPNLQQIAKTSEKDWNGNLKKAFIARPGYELWTIDYAQLQFRMTCAYANQTELIEIFNDEKRDIFQEMANSMRWLRNNVKTLVYLIMFGGGAKRASVAFGVSIGEGGELVNEFHAHYPEIKKLSKEAEKAAIKQRYVSLWTGRRRHFKRGVPTYRALNAVIQGGEAEIIKRAMIQLAHELCNEEFRLVLQIHDEIVFEIKKGMADHYLPKAQKIMEGIGKRFCEYVGVQVDLRTSVKEWGKK